MRLLIATITFALSGCSTAHVTSPDHDWLPITDAIYGTDRSRCGSSFWDQFSNGSAFILYSPPNDCTRYPEEFECDNRHGIAKFLACTHLTETLIADFVLWPAIPAAYVLDFAFLPVHSLGHALAFNWGADSGKGSNVATLRHLKGVSRVAGRAANIVPTPAATALAGLQAAEDVADLIPDSEYEKASLDNQVKVEEVTEEEWIAAVQGKDKFVGSTGLETLPLKDYDPFASPHKVRPVKGDSWSGPFRDWCLNYVDIDVPNGSTEVGKDGACWIKR